MGDDGYGSPVFGAQNALVRDWIKSRNYVPGVSGWQLDADGDADLNDVTVRGTIIVGVLPDPQVEIIVDPSLGQAAILLKTNAVNETSPGAIFTQNNAYGEQATWVRSPEEGGDFQTLLAVVSGQNPAVNPEFPSQVTGGHFSFNTTDPAGFALVQLPGATGMWINGINMDTVGVGTAIVVPFQIGLWLAENLRLGPDQIQASNNGVASDLFVQNAGGKSWFGGAVDTGILTAANMRRGVATTPAPGGAGPAFISSVAVNFASVMPGTPTVVVTPTSAVGAIDSWSATAITANGFTLNSNRTNNNATNFNYFAIGSF